MIVLSHRGYWVTEEEKNTFIAFERSFKLGFGTETDIRDHDGDLVISHDVPSGYSHISVDDFFSFYKSFDENLPLALNIKADGLQNLLIEKLKRFDITNYFVFDMSVPDGLLYLNNGCKTFSRQSEYEINPSFYDVCDGIWLDEFERHWINKDVLQNHINNNKKICIVSPELHKRPYLTEWEDYKLACKYLNTDIMICTDIPEEAKTYFNEN